MRAGGWWVTRDGSVRVWLGSAGSLPPVLPEGVPADADALERLPGLDDEVSAMP